MAKVVKVQSSSHLLYLNLYLATAEGLYAGVPSRLTEQQTLIFILWVF